MEPATFDYEIFAFGILVGMLGLFLLIKLGHAVDHLIQWHVERKYEQRMDEQRERMKRLIMEETINQLEDHANCEDE